MENKKYILGPEVTEEMKEVGGDIIQDAFEKRDNGWYATADSIAEAAYIAMNRIREVEHASIAPHTQDR